MITTSSTIGENLKQVIQDKMLSNLSSKHLILLHSHKLLENLLIKICSKLFKLSLINIKDLMKCNTSYTMFKLSKQEDIHFLQIKIKLMLLHQSNKSFKRLFLILKMKKLSSKKNQLLGICLVFIIIKSGKPNKGVFRC